MPGLQQDTLDTLLWLWHLCRTGKSNTRDALPSVWQLEDKELIPRHLSGIKDLGLDPGILPKVSECFRAVTCFKIDLRTSRGIGEIKALLGCTFCLAILYFYHYRNSGK